MAIPKSFIAQLLLYCEVEDIISSYIPIKRVGRNRKALCPFHSEKTPSLTIYPDTQSFYCFGCGTGGDVITFVMQIEHLDYVEAVHFLARRMGMTVPDELGQDDTYLKKNRILEINRETAHFFHGALKSPDGSAALTYLRERGVPDHIIVKYGVGYAPDGWTHLRDHLKTKGYSYEDMEMARVVVNGKQDRFYDQFRNRVMFPIIDVRGKVIAFGGRVLDDSKPKYLNSSDSLVFKKSRNLFSLNFAKQKSGERIILAEGYMDVIAIHAAGLENAVATLGTALTPEQTRLLAKYAAEVVIAYDSDAAGVKAGLRAKSLFSQIDMSVKIIKLSEAKDPDEYIKKFGARRFEMLVDGAQDIWRFELDKLKEAFDLTQPDQKTAYIRKACSLLSGMSDKTEREVYAGELAKQVNIPRDTVVSRVNGIHESNRKKQEKQREKDIITNKKVISDRTNPEKPNFLRPAVAEERIIGLLLRNPDYIPYFLEKMKTDELVTTFNKRVLESIVLLFQQSGSVTMTDLIPLFSSQEYARIAGMLAEESKLELRPGTLDELIQAIGKHNASLLNKDVAAMSPEEIMQHLSKYK